FSKGPGTPATLFVQKTCRTLHSEKWMSRSRSWSKKEKIKHFQKSVTGFDPQSKAVTENVT
ncbi:MAG: hypothetical protein ABJA78_19925, partial [Ferruginibacter sp.]